MHLNMKNLKLWMMAAVLIYGATVLTACSNDDRPAVSGKKLAEKIIGKWMIADIDGKPALTNDKSVVTFLSDSKATFSSSRSDFTESTVKWQSHVAYDAEISGNKITLTGLPNEAVRIVQTYHVTAIDDAQMIAKFNLTRYHHDEVIADTKQHIRYTKVATDYSEAIIGLWECTELTGIETFNDANARLEFMADGTYKFYRKNDAGDWESVTTREFQKYFVDGQLLSTRWKNHGENELREWWEIDSIDGNKMAWSALRQSDNDNTVQQVMKWKKVE